MLINSSLDTREKLSILSQDSQYDLACACGTKNDDHRQRSLDGRWLYPVALPNGGYSVLLKTLVSNACVNDCKYCPLRIAADVRRCTLEPEKLVAAFMQYYRAKKVFGLFISSGVTGTPDAAMARINAVASILRKRERFKGYIHLKVIPGASDAAIEQSLSLASAVSLNIETTSKEHCRKICASKDYEQDVLRPIGLISRLTGKGMPYSRVKQTTQFVVAASDETDREIINSSWQLYRQMHLDRIYFSAYQRGLGAADLPGENSTAANADLLTREHRLYQVDWLFRKYGFGADEIPLEQSGNLSLSVDPKELWARHHPEFFPVDINRGEKAQLLRVPGLGPTTVQRILTIRKEHGKIRSIDALGRMGKRLGKVKEYVKF